MMKNMNTLPQDWLAECEDWLGENEDGSHFEIPSEIDGKPNVPTYVSGFVKDGDWVIGVKVVKSVDYLREHGINDGDIVGFAINWKIFC